jgi:glutamate/tyrosine decarboxylase-like PLP-dependent enzyme
VRLLGLGHASLKMLQQNDRDTLKPAALESALCGLNGKPALVILQAGDVNTGGFDDLEALIPVARKYRAWTHVDGAFGMWVTASPCYAHLVQGMEKVYSWTTDGHKWLNVPNDCGYAFVANPTRIVTRCLIRQAISRTRTSCVIRSTGTRSSLVAQADSPATQRCVCLAVMAYAR